MSVNTCQVYVQQLLDGLAMPNGGFNLNAYITPPDPNVEAENPTAYVWPSQGEESRAPFRGGTIPRALYEDGFSGTKSLFHELDVYVVWFGQNDDPDADTWFPGMVDAIMACLRVSPSPVMVTDQYTSKQSQLISVGEDMSYKIAVNAVADQRFNRYDALITLRINELFSA